ncbi:hypothetical protein V6N13_089806, partial [Hibiscus sabdariffa]
VYDVTLYVEEHPGGDAILAHAGDDSIEGFFNFKTFHFLRFGILDVVYVLFTNLSDSIELLSQCGIDFKKNNEKGINAKRFAKLSMSSEVVLNDGVCLIVKSGSLICTCGIRYQAYDGVLQQPSWWVEQACRVAHKNKVKSTVNNSKVYDVTSYVKEHQVVMPSWHMSEMIQPKPQHATRVFDMIDDFYIGDLPK